MTYLPTFGIAQTLLQLRILGYKDGDRVYIRLLAGKGYDVKQDKLYPFDGYLTLSNGREFSFTRLKPKSKGGGEGFTTPNGYQYLLQENQKGYSIYLIVNEGGRKDENITRCPALFYECDGISKDKQWERIERLPIKPSLVVETRNSLHCYYRTHEQSPDRWRSLQQRLIQLMDSDSSIHNESRLMRLAGFYYQKKGLEPHPIVIQLANDAIYHRAQFEELLPAWDESRWSATRERVTDEEIKQRLEVTKQRREQQLNSIDEFPLNICLSKDDRYLIVHGAGEGQRNNLGFKLASNLIATANWLNYTGYKYQGNHRELFEEFCDRCTPPISNRERDSIWKSANNSNPTPSLPDTAIENCIKAWQWQQLSESERQRLRGNSGEPDPVAYQAYVEWESEQEETEKVIATQKKIDKFVSWFRKGVKRFKPKGFGQSSTVIKTIKSIDYTPGCLPSPDEWQAMGEPEIIFTQGQREKIWLEAFSKGYAVHDASFMGSGKSYAVPNLANEDGKIFYLSNNHRHPSIPKIEEQFTDLDPRTQYGFYTDDSGVKRVATVDTPEESIEKRSICTHADKFHLWSQKGYNVNAKTETDESGNTPLNPICASCQYNKWKVEDGNGNRIAFCAATSGSYRHDRKEALSNSTIRASLQSLSRDSNYSNDIFVVEEASKELTATKSIETWLNQLIIEFDKAKDFIEGNQDWIDYLNSLMIATKAVFSIKQPHGGLTHDDIISLFPKPDLDIQELIWFLNGRFNNIKDLIVEADSISYGGNKRYKTVAKTARVYFKKEADFETLKNIESLPNFALVNILKAINGENVIFRLSGKTLTLIVENRWYASIFNQAKGVILLDGTASTEKLKLLSGIDKPILTVRERVEKPLANLTIYNINTAGLGSSQFSEAAITRITALLNTLKADLGDFPIIAHKAYQEVLEACGYWFNDNRGSNAYEGKTNLVAIGSPFPNLGAVQDTYRVLKGTMNGFDEYYQDCVREEILQLSGRQRCQRYPDRQFHLWMIGTKADLSWLSQYGAKVVERDAFEINPKAGNKRQYALYQLIEYVKATGARTQAEVANAIGKTQQAISKLLKELGVTLSELIERLQKLTSAYTTDSIETLYRAGCTRSVTLKDRYFRDLFSLPLLELAKQIIEVINNFGWRDFKQHFLEDYPEALQIKVLSVLMGVMFSETIQFDTT